jgi:hypothetical protein
LSLGRRTKSTGGSLRGSADSWRRNVQGMTAVAVVRPSRTSCGCLKALQSSHSRTSEYESLGWQVRILPAAPATAVCRRLPRRYRPECDSVAWTAIPCGEKFESSGV